MYNMIDLYTDIWQYMILQYKITISLFCIQFLISYFLLFSGIKNESYTDVSILSQQPDWR